MLTRITFVDLGAALKASERMTTFLAELTEKRYVGPVVVELSDGLDTMGNTGVNVYESLDDASE